MHEENNQSNYDQNEHKKHAHVKFEELTSLFIKRVSFQVVLNVLLVSSRVVTWDVNSWNRFVEKFTKRFPSVFQIPNKLAICRYDFLNLYI